MGGRLAETRTQPPAARPILRASKGRGPEDVIAALTRPPGSTRPVDVVHGEALTPVILNDLAVLVDAHDVLGGLFGDLVLGHFLVPRPRGPRIKC